ncbi:class V lanthionine synthetase subunit LxmK [Streptomyces sp. ATexAB-D23]|uniref:class V lanthionine synthetase subunit LxmK n=1 Tax=unclassified Streptomyces TaxID=2593676 RepID=UPI000375D33E|nr:class V lanthionine synthetase subunit LxmK [Streptomyces sp. ATexAB-D23]MYY04291.1 choline kinase [Streptomyces sp. SID4913]
MSVTDVGRTVLAPPPLDAAGEVNTLLSELGLGTLREEQAGAYAGRNDNWFGPTTTGAAVFVKRMNGPDVSRRLDRMAAFDRALALARQCTTLSWDTPQLLGLRPASGLAVFALLDGAESLSDLAPEGELPVELCRRTGRALAEVHMLPWPDAPAGPADAPVAPVMRFLDFLSEKTWQTSSAAELELWSLLQHDAALAGGLRALPHGGTSGLVPSHGDLRLDQFLLHGDRLHLTDWEEFRPAEPELDLGGLVGELVHRAVRCLTDTLDDGLADDPRAAHAAIMSRGRLALARIRPGVGALMEAYRAVRGPVDPARIAARAGWHLFDRILAGARHSNRLHPLDRAQAGIGRALILAPQRSSGAIGLTEAH